MRPARQKDGTITHEPKRETIIYLNISTKCKNGQSSCGEGLPLTWRSSVPIMIGMLSMVFSYNDGRKKLKVKSHRRRLTALHVTILTFFTIVIKEVRPVELITVAIPTTDWHNPPVCLCVVL
eukprot:TRINITY_DN4462_c0_g1_i4.p2 TRINITY_DN4462_c0_g1~~TRINITY_DN4462_c0_g1_i4.p2  ORF type:complete len:122 (+),score=9.76 TRINITY_DN4462_c0_g1_i4:420-785(+)